MSDPADKSDDLIAELAKLMASSAQGNDAPLKPITMPAPLSPNAGSASPGPVRIPGMDAPAPVSTVPAVQPQAPAGLRIPGGDQPAPQPPTTPASPPVAAPPSKFDFGRPPASASAMTQEPLSTLSERIAARAAAEAGPRADVPAPRSEPGHVPAAPSGVRIPSDLRPVSENKSFAEGPALSVNAPTRPAAPEQPKPPQPELQTDAAPHDKAAHDHFDFDFGFDRHPPGSAAELSATPDPEHDAIAELIAADLDESVDVEFDETDESDQAEPAPAVIGLPPRAPRPDFAGAAPPPSMVKVAVTPQPAATKPTLSPATPGTQPPLGMNPVPLKPVVVAPRSSEGDRFAISPGVGLNVRPAANQPLKTPVVRAPEPAPVDDDELDPMSEIENLIGEAVRVELSGPAPVKVQAAAPSRPDESDDDDDEPRLDSDARGAQPAPIVPPLNSQFAPRRAAIRDGEGHRDAEATILAAAAATGSEPGHFGALNVDDGPYKRLKVKPQQAGLSGGLRQYVGMAVAGTLLLAAGFGLYWVLGMSHGDSDQNAPVLTADATPVKETPAATAAPATDATRSPVLDQLAGVTANPDEQLVSTDETTGQDVNRVVTPVADTSESGLANRKVRTVTVRPDGTIVSSDDSVAGSQALPVDRPNVPNFPGGNTTDTALLSNNVDAAAVDPIATAIASDAAATDAIAASTDFASIAPVIDATKIAPVPAHAPDRAALLLAFGGSSATVTPVNAVIGGAQTPNGQIDLLAGSNTSTRSAAPVSSSGSAAAYVQIASMPTEEDATAHIRTATARWGSLFEGNSLTVQRADLGQKGIRYRVRLPAASLSDASRICAQIKADGGDCFATSS